MLGNVGDENLTKEDAFHNMWWGMFTPTPTVLKLLEQFMKHLDLVPNKFAFAHYRASFPGEKFQKTGDLTVLRDTTINAIHCAIAAVGPGYPIYVASDNVKALEFAKNYSKESGIRIVTHLDLPRIDQFAFLSPKDNPPHLNFAEAVDPASFYPVFLDLLTFSLSRCASYGSGGFGLLGNRISYNSSCFLEHTIEGRVRHCEAPSPVSNAKDSR